MLKRKQLLAHIRSGDYAHAGEVEAIELALGRLPKDSRRSLLDVGCGLGGTANYVQEHGWGQVTGVDVDPAMIQYAQHRYPDVQFQLCEASQVAQVLGRDVFDVVYLFNAFYCFESRLECLRAMADASKNDGQLVIFDYSSPGQYIDGDIFYDDKRLYSKTFDPINLSTIEIDLKSAGWRLENSLDLTTQFEAWYGWLKTTMNDQREELIRRFGDDTFDDLFRAYCRLLDLISAGKIGGVVVFAVKS